MKRLFISMLIATGLTLVGVRSFAETEPQTGQMSGIGQIKGGKHTKYIGEITEIEGNTIELKNEIGKTNSFKLADPEAVKGLKVGDKVAIHLYKFDESKSTSTNAGKFISTVRGKVTKVEANTLTLQDETGTTHSLDVAHATMLQGLKAGDSVVVGLQRVEATATPSPATTPVPETSPMGTPTRSPNPSPAM